MELNAMHWLQIVSGGAANVLVSGVWQGLLLAAAIWLCLKVTPKTSAATRFTIWTAAFLVLAVLPFLRISSSPQPGMAAVSNLAAGSNGPMFQLDIRWSFGIAAAWMTASFFRAASLAVSGLRLRRLWKGARPVDEVQFGGLRSGLWGSQLSGSGLLGSEAGGSGGLGSLAWVAAGAGRRAQLCTSNDLDRPSVIGFFSPRIVIPTWLLEKLTRGELEQIVLHETEHLRRGDDWINLAQKLCLVLFPLNPVLIWIDRRLCIERELACDDGVIRSTGAPRAYASCLTNLAERGLKRRSALLSLGAWERRSSLASRVYKILRRDEVMSPVQARSLTGAMLLGLLMGAAGLSRSPQLILFSPERPVEAQVHPAGSYTAAAYSQGLYHDVRFGESREQRATLLKVSADSPAPDSRRGVRATAPGAGKRISRPVTSLAPTKVEMSQSIQGQLDQGQSIQGQSRQGQLNQSQSNQDWMVVTAWESSNAPGMVLTVFDRKLFVSGCSAPVESDWIIFQL